MVTPSVTFAHPVRQSERRLNVSKTRHVDAYACRFLALTCGASATLKPVHRRR
jgi:hypothetical protein